jgi:hypothetical protein
MRIYIKDYNLKKMQNIINLLNKSGKFDIVETQCREIYSNEGIYVISIYNNIEQLYIQDKEIITIENYYNNNTLLIDNSIILKGDVHQIPVEHILQSITRYIICTSEKSPIKLVIEYNNDMDYIKDNKLNNIDIAIPNNFYFETKNEIDLNNECIKKEIIVFLSLLN